MKKLDKDYIVGLDIGVSNNGYAAIDDDFNIIKHRHRHEIGVVEFKKAQTAEKTRIARGSRRRYHHQKWRLKQLKSYFWPHFVDLIGEEKTSEYFKSFENSWISDKDELRMNKRRAFNSEISKFPTRYHATVALIENSPEVPTESERRLKLIYEALHPMVKYRGNFLRKEKVEDLNLNELDIQSSLNTINTALNDFLANEDGLLFGVETKNYKDVEKLLLSTEYTKKQKADKLKKLLSSKDYDADSADLVAKFLVGGEVTNKTVAKVLNVDTYSTFSAKNQKFTLNPNSDKAVEDIEKLESILNNSGKIILSNLKLIYNQVTLCDLIPLGKTYSVAMVDSYNKFGTQLSTLKRIAKQIDIENGDELQKIVDGYLHFKHRGNKKTSPSEFYNKMKAIIKKLKGKVDDHELKKLSNLVDREALLLPQRNYKNGTIPHQVNQLELRRIIESQSKIPGFEWLADDDRIDPKRDEKYNLERFIDFRIPYFVGPLTTSKDSRFAWLVFKDDVKREPLTVWNFEEQIDFEKTIENFITRMTATDTYLLGEPVLPAESMTYQKFEVLNELNSTRVAVKLNGTKIRKESLTVLEKQTIFRELFMQHKKVTTKQVANVLKCKFNRHVDENDITGPSDGENYTSNLSTFLTLQKIGNLDKSLLTSEEYQDDWDEIARYLTIFEKDDVVRKVNRIKKLKIAQISGFPIKEIASLGLNDWGRLSSLLLRHTYSDEDSKKISIMDKLWNDKLNFQQIIKKESYQEQIAKYNKAHNVATSKKQIIDRILKYSRISPEDGRSVRVCVDAIEDLVRFNGHEPKIIALEFARGPKKTNNAPKYYRIKKMIEEQISNKDWQEQLLKDFKGIKDPKDFGIKEFLYFSQNCKDIYDPSHTINLNKLDLYEVDHIYPRSINGKDDSLDNLVLTQHVNNQKKGNHPAIKVFSSKRVQAYWKKLKEIGFISEDKYNNLIRNWEDDASAQFKIRMLKRSLVQTSSVTKITAQILTALYPDTKIVAINAGLSHGIRKKFNLYKVREVNDFHHGVDAYLAAFEALYLWKLYPKLRPLIDYNDYQKLDDKALRKLDLSKFAFSKLELKKSTDVPSEFIYNSDGEIVGKRAKLVKRLINLRNPDNIRITTLPEKAKGSLFKATILHANPDAKSGIARKVNMPLGIYGYYTEVATNKILLIKTHKVKKGEKVSQYKLDKLTSLNANLSREKVIELVSKKLKKGEILDRVVYLPINTMLERRVPVTWKDKNGLHKKLVTERFTLSSNDEYHNFNGFTLSDDAMHFLQDTKSELKEILDPKELNEFRKKYPRYNDVNDALNKIFDEILYQCQTKMPLIGQNHKPFNQLESDKSINSFHEEKDPQKKLEDIEAILLAVTDTSRCELSGLNSIKGLSGSLGRFNRRISDHLTDDTVIVFSSVTGLFERKIAFKDL